MRHPSSSVYTHPGSRPGIRYTLGEAAARKGEGVAKKTKKPKRGSRVTPAKLVALKKPPKGPSKASSKAGVDNAPASEETTSLARITQLEADRANLMAQVAWARGVAQEQQKALDAERQRTDSLTADLEAQRARIEQLKALSVLDRLLGRHKRI